MLDKTIRGPVARMIAPCLVAILITGGAAIGGDEPSRFGRLFRLGSGAAPSTHAAHDHASDASSMSRSVPDQHGLPALSTPPSTPPGAMSGPKLTPRPRVNKPVTEADPLVTRISLGRSDNGTQFGMLFQVFADGTIIDGEGVHHVSAEALRPVVEAISSGDLGRIKGHCGGPAGDFIETVHVVAYERSYGRLRANAFSYSGNPQGCDHAVHHLQKVLDELQGKVGQASPPVGSTADATYPVPASQPLSTSPPLPLTSTP
ncbi:hypothetical protein P12x_001710 [Tundrisphaera lichenicola]|uniref:hypothetical protein n=1 Tax=Tundrisphaera lichenicola TaxID=2029860 RepID=UPI003EB9DBBF